MKERARTENVSIPKIYEDEILRLASEELSVEVVKKIVPPLELIQRALYLSKHDGILFCHH
jgi:hypothetical protein